MNARGGRGARPQRPGERRREEGARRRGTHTHTHSNRLRPRGAPPGPPHHCPPALSSDCACSHQPAESRGAQGSRSPHRSPANSEKCETWLGGWGVGEEKQKLGAAPPFGNLRSSWVLRGPPGTQTSPSPAPQGPRPPVCLHLYLYLCPARSPTSPWLQKPGCLCPGPPPTEPHSPVPPAVAPSLPLPSVGLAWLCGDGDSGNPVAPEAGPQRATRRQARQADRSRARARGEWGKALAGAPSHMLLGGRGTPAFQTLPLESGMENLRSIDNDHHICGVALSLRNPHTACSFELTATQLSLRGGGVITPFCR